MKIEGKKIIFVGIFIVFILVFILGNVDSKKDSLGELKNNKKVDSNILKQLSLNETAKVIVLLNSENEKSSKIKILKLTNQKIRDTGKIISGEMNISEIESLSADSSVQKIFLDRPVQAFLQQSVGIIEANKTWINQLNGINLTGTGQAVCILDTGINYSHRDFGSCNISRLNLNGNTINYVLESAHNYQNNFDYTWKINYTGFTNISIHFKNISLEYQGESLSCPDGCDSWDRIIVYNTQMKEIASYHGTNSAITDLWSPASAGDTIYVRLISDNGVRAYGFYIDQIINGTTNYTYDWSGCNKIPYGWDFANNDGDPLDDHGHGTHVAGIVGANGSIRGVAPGSKIIIGKVLDQTGSGWTSDVYYGIEWCINNSEKYNISIISMSLGDPSAHYLTYCNDDALYSPIQEAISKNISVVIASGNENNYSGISSPACIQNTIPVGATDKSDNFAAYSNRNWMVKLFAPGSGIDSTWFNGEYRSDSGTSMAAPHVSGAIAIINQYLRLKGQTKTPQEIENILNATGKRIYDSSSGLNFSRIDVYSAIRSLCADNLSNTSWQNLGNISSCRANNTLLYNFSRIEYDANNCGFTNNITHYIINESSCDSCIPNWTARTTNNVIWYNDTNNCYAQTNLSSDLESRPFNLSMQIEENKTQFFDNESNNSLIIEMNFNFSTSNNYFSSINISKQNNESNFSYMIIGGINLTENATWTKTVYLNKTLNSGLICVKDAEVDSIQNISAKCNESNEYLFNACPKNISNYGCLDNGTNFKITGLRNSGIKEQEPFCGDGICNASLSESCSVCASDCGSCPATSGGGSSGGGGGGASVQNYALTDSELFAGTNKNIAQGGKATFVISEINHSLTIQKIDSTKKEVNFIVRSDPINLTFKVGDEARLNLTSAEYFDLYVRLENITSGKANITIQKIFESRPEFMSKDKGKQYHIMNETNETKTGIINNINENLPIKYQIAIIVLLAIFVFGYYLIARKHKLNKRKSK